MRDILGKWVNDADALHHVQRFGFSDVPLQLRYLQRRQDDYYISLVGELFDRLRSPYDEPIDWSRLGNAITQAATIRRQIDDSTADTLPSEAALFSAAAFYFGGYSASAYLTLKASERTEDTSIQRACYELLARPATLESPRVRKIVGAIRKGNLQLIRDLLAEAKEQEDVALGAGPVRWVRWRLFRQILSKFEQTNIRAVLPNGEDRFWDQLVRSLLNRTPPAWDFFPSQIDAIKSGLLESEATFSMQMPTGAGKTALSETLLYHHLKSKPADVAVLLVPYRSIASELRGSLVKRLNEMDLPARCAYGGTVPTADEVRGLEDTRVIVATPEALSGLLSTEPDFFGRLSLVICDEGHLLDGEARGVGLELLLARMRAHDHRSLKFVFISAIVPNIEEINAWLGGTDETVVRSTYRPSVAEFAVLQVAGNGVGQSIGLQLHPHESDMRRFAIPRFLSQEDFRYRNPATGRLKTYPFDTIKAHAIGAARKALSMGAVAVFAANKRGNQGAVGLAEELLAQLDCPLPLPRPSQFIAHASRLQAAVEYFLMEYGPDWIGTRALREAVILHHGDIPQESREVVESMVRRGTIRLAICTSTLAEGVNLPIRTLVLYSVQRRGPDGAAENLLARDIKNLVGRAGRAGATTKGLVICANPQQWSLVEPVAQQRPGERVAGALLELMGRLRRGLQQQSLRITNQILEEEIELHTLVDGIDATLIDLATEELGEHELIRLAGELSERTFAAQQADSETVTLMREVFELRARRVVEIRNAGRLGWIRETGARARMIDSVELRLLPLRKQWDDLVVPTDPTLVQVLLKWAWDLPEMQDALAAAYREAIPTIDAFESLVSLWLDGFSFSEMAAWSTLEIDTLLGVHARVLSYVLQTAVEQGIALLRHLLEARGQELAQAAIDFPEHLRFGVPTSAGRILAAAGVRHRRAAVALGRAPELEDVPDDRSIVLEIARPLIADTNRWLPKLGNLVLENTREDLEEDASSTAI